MRISEMAWVFASLIAFGLVPLGLAFWAQRRTSLAHALVWAILAWGSWALAVALEGATTAPATTARFVALCFTACAGVAVLGARRPHVFAWNFVVLGLFAVMVWPLVESMLIGADTFAGLRLAFLALTIAVGVGNYALSRLAPAALLLLFTCAMELLGWFGTERLPDAKFIDGALAAVPWVGWLCWRRRGNERSAFDRCWLDFRDSFGVMWSQRVRDQFNNAAANAGWPVRLKWGGVSMRAGAGENEKYLETLRAVLQRFAAID